MTAVQLRDVVKPTGLVSDHLLLKAYEYQALLSAGARDIEEGPMYTKRNIPAYADIPFTFGIKTSHETIEISNSQYTAASSSMTGPVVAFSNRPFTGREYIELEIEKGGDYLCGYLGIGLTRNIDDKTIYAQNGGDCVVYLNQGNYTMLYCFSSTGAQYGKTFQTGDRIGIHVDTRRGTVEFFHNDSPLGLASNQVGEGYYFAVFLYYPHNRVTLRTNRQPPKSK